ncbi:MAG: serine acetyltransferase [Deltaproteobacteria bacterium]|nr:serine acetyltransferase [Deltaproteobacteria bacterium]
MIGDLIEDGIALTRAARIPLSARSVLSTIAQNDSFAIAILVRARQSLANAHIPVLGRALRQIQASLYGIEIDTEVTLGHGVYFIHTLGTVIGGTSKIGDRVRFYGNNTVGTAKENGYPVIESNVEVGCGARVLGPITVGARSFIGANAVVLDDVPPDSIAVGVPARVIPRRPKEDHRDEYQGDQSERDHRFGRAHVSGAPSDLAAHLDSRSGGTVANAGDRPD